MIEWPDDELSVYATLRGPLFAFHDEDLIAFKHLHGRLSPIAWLSRDGNEIAGALQLLAQLHTKRNRRAIADTLMRLLAATHLRPTFRPAMERVKMSVTLTFRFSLKRKLPPLLMFLAPPETAPPTARATLPGAVTP